MSPLLAAWVITGPLLGYLIGFALGFDTRDKEEEK